MYSIPNISYVITDILLLIFKQEINKRCFIKKFMYHWRHTTKPHQSSQCDQLLNIGFLFPTCTFLRPGKPKSISEQHDGLSHNPCLLKQGLWDICLYRLTPRLKQSPTQRSYNWYSMERHETFTECWGKNVCIFVSKLPVKFHGVLLWHGNKLTFYQNKYKFWW